MQNEDTPETHIRFSSELGPFIFSAMPNLATQAARRSVAKYGIRHCSESRKGNKTQHSWVAVNNLPQQDASSHQLREAKIAAHSEEAREKLQRVEISAICSQGMWQEAKSHMSQGRRKASRHDAPKSKELDGVVKEQKAAESNLDQAFQKLQLESDGESLERYFDALEIESSNSKSPSPHRLSARPHFASQLSDQQSSELNIRQQGQSQTTARDSSGRSLPAASSAVREGLRLELPSADASLLEEAEEAQSKSDSLSDSLSLPSDALPGGSWPNSSSQDSGSRRSSFGGGNASPAVAGRSEVSQGAADGLAAVNRLEVNELYYDALENPSPQSPPLNLPSPLTEKNLWLSPGGSQEAKLTIQRALR